MIEIKNLSKTYHLKNGDVEAIRNISLQIKEKEIYGIIGYSGAGKSSLLRCLNLLELPDAGDIRVGNTQLTKMVQIENKKNHTIEEKIKRKKGKELRLARRNIGMIFQHFNLLDRSTVFDNVAYPLKYSKKNKKEIEIKVKQLLELVDLTDKIDVYPSQLSGGQKQRVAIARALANDPKVLLSDEATSALDPEATESILELLKKLNEKLGLTIVLITHEMSVIKSICHRVAVMEQGNIIEEGNVYDIFANPKQQTTKKFVNSISSLSKIHSMIETHSSLILPQGKGKLVQLRFLKDSVGNALISEVSRKFNVNMSIVLANVDLLQGNPLGGVIAVIEGEEENIISALEYFKNNLVNVEVLYNGAVV